MKCTLAEISASRPAGDLLVFPVDGKWKEHAALRAVDRKLRGKLLREGERRGFRGAPGDDFVFQTQGALPPAVIALLGWSGRGDIADCNAIGERIARLAEKEGAKSAAVALGDRADAATVEGLRAAVELARYRFTALRSSPPRQAPLHLIIGCDNPRAAELRQAVAAGGTEAVATNLARDLCNLPAGELTPKAFGERVLALANDDLAVQVHDRGALEALGMGAILGVARGSHNDPCLIEMRYEPAAAPRRHVALVGKGITFDSGGLSIKPASGMESMKRDMAGGAVVVAALQAVAAMKLPLRVRGYVAAAENMPDGNAIRPGDVLRAFDGKTIEVLNTDAEGRLVLADALGYAARQKPAAMIDFATLTGAVRIALGKRYAAVMGNQPAVVDECLAAARTCNEGLWELPLVDEYRSDLESQIADIKNTGAGYAGTIIGGLFLRDFVAGLPWAHIDFSSTVVSDGYPAHPKGPSGYGVRTAIRLLRNRAAALGE